MKESKLVTLAILPYSKAQILQSILESEGIEAHIHNVNLIQPVISSGVRVRISEDDLPRALKIVGDSVWLQSEMNETQKNDSDEHPYILIPVDFSSCSLNACKFGFKLAAYFQIKVVLLHVYFTPIYVPGLSYDTENLHFPYSDSASSVRGVIERVHKQFNELTDKISQMITAGELPEVSYSCLLKEGVVEEEILRYARTHIPKLIVAGTHGEEKMEHSLIGSVAAELIERSPTMVYTIPEEVTQSIQDIKRIALFTSFDQRDIFAFDSLIKTFTGSSFDITLIHISSHEAKRLSNEDKLIELKDYFRKKYPQLQVRYATIEEETLLEDIDTLVEERHIQTICIANYRRNIFARLFNSSMAYRMLFHAKTPILIIK